LRTTSNFSEQRAEREADGMKQRESIGEPAGGDWVTENVRPLETECAAR
jgi:hypothetical protein